MKNISKTILAVLAVGLLSCTLFSQRAHAIPITGEIDMSGTAFLDNVFLGLATKTTGYGAISVGGIPTGSFAGTAGDSVTWTTFGWAPFFSSGHLWTFTDAGTGFTYSFDLSGDTIMHQDNMFLNLLGTGTVSITGNGSPYDTTTATWSFTISNPDGGPHSNFAFTFANSQTTTPDGGSAVALLGIALAGIEGMRRMLRARKS
jgi:VPDSG-CTERM motif